MKKFTVILLAFFMITGCGGMGKVANLKSEFLPNDHDKTCEQLGIEISSIEDDIADVKKRKDRANGGRVVVGVLGIIFMPALFAYDLSNTEQTELRSYEKRYEVLKNLSITKECKIEFKTDEDKVIYPTVEDDMVE